MGPATCGGPYQSWQPDTSRDAFAQHCAAFSGAQQAFFFGLVSSFMALSSVGQPSAFSGQPDH